jgi:hypothetical protein
MDLVTKHIQQLLQTPLTICFPSKFNLFIARNRRSLMPQSYSFQNKQQYMGPSIDVTQ